MDFEGCSTFGTWHRGNLSLFLWFCKTEFAHVVLIRIWQTRLYHNLPSNFVEVKCHRVHPQQLFNLCSSAAIGWLADGTAERLKRSWWMIISGVEIFVKWLKEQQPMVTLTSRCGFKARMNPSVSRNIHKQEQPRREKGEKSALHPSMQN